MAIKGDCMGFLVSYLTTVILSVGMKFASDVRIYKDAADQGYKILFDMDLFKLPFLIPLFNIFWVVKNTVEYDRDYRSEVLFYLNEIKALEEMNELEKSEYAKKPSALNAFLVPKKWDRILNSSLCISVDTDKEKGKIFYKFNRLGKNVKIIAATGTFASLTKEEQKRKVFETTEKILDFVNKGVEEYYSDNPNTSKSPKTLYSDILDSIDLEEIKVTDNDDDYKKNLKELKEILLTMEDDQKDQQDRKNNVKSLKKKSK